jgi:2-polyprenyl-3-methyl-5-hydroxy-6-metoxy-1,4-benzoquinol methylase
MRPRPASARRVALGDLRSRLRNDFASLLRAEQRATIVDVGAGPGLDMAEWQADGFQVIGADLVPANVARPRWASARGAVWTSKAPRVRGPSTVPILLTCLA